MTCTTIQILIPDRPSPGIPRPLCSTPSFVDREKSARKKTPSNAQWNVRTLLDREITNRPERRTALVAMELAKYNIDIAVLSETRFHASGSLNDLEYTFYWSDKPNRERREAGVGFAIKRDIVAKLTEMPHPVSDRIMTMRIPLTKDRNATIVNAYAPTMTNPEENKDTFYNQLKGTLRNIPSTDKLLLIGDFNARIGRENDKWPSALDKYGIGKCNSNGELLLALCTEFDLIVSNTMLKQKDAHNTTWTHPRSRHGHMIDFITTRWRDKMDICSARTMRGANCGTDHQMLRSRVMFSIRKKHKQKGAMKPVNLNTSKLRNTSHAESLVQEMDHALAQSSEDNETPCWTSLRQVVYDTTKASLGKHEKKHQDWFDPNDQILRYLMAKRDQAHERVLQIRSTRSAVQDYKDACRILQKYTRARKSEWWEMKAEELQRAADRNDMKAFTVD